MGEDETNAPENGRVFEVGTSQDPIFVDSTGRRARVVRRVGYALTGLCATYMVVLGLSLAGVTSIAPSTLVPLPGVPSEPLTSRTETELGTPAARTGSQGRTDAGSTTSDAAPGDSFVPGSAVPTSDGQGIPGTAATGTPTSGPKPAATSGPVQPPATSKPTDPAPQQPPAEDPAPSQPPAEEPAPEGTPTEPAPQETPVPEETPTEPAPQETPVPEETPTDPTDPPTGDSGTSDPGGVLSDILSDVLSPVASLLPAAPR